MFVETVALRCISILTHAKLRRGGGDRLHVSSSAQLHSFASFSTSVFAATGGWRSALNGVWSTWIHTNHSVFRTLCAVCWLSTKCAVAHSKRLPSKPWIPTRLPFAPRWGGTVRFLRTCYDRGDPNFRHPCTPPLTPSPPRCRGGSMGRSLKTQ